MALEPPQSCPMGLEMSHFGYISPLGLRLCRMATSTSRTNQIHDWMRDEKVASWQSGPVGGCTDCAAMQPRVVHWIWGLVQWTGEAQSLTCLLKHVGLILNCKQARPGACWSTFGVCRDAQARSGLHGHVAGLWARGGGTMSHVRTTAASTIKLMLPAS